MKKLIFNLSVLFFFGIVIFITSCQKDNSPTDTDVRTKFTGSWFCLEKSGLSYTVDISLDPSNSSQILLANFHYQGNGEKAYATATSSSFTIPYQGMCNNAIHVNGTGNFINDNKLTLVYYVNNQTDVDTIQATYTK
jgi:hypothetical protein